MITYEYTAKDVSIGDTIDLDLYGSIGWELCAVVAIHPEINQYIFKRIKHRYR